VERDETVKDLDGERTDRGLNDLSKLRYDSYVQSLQDKNWRLEGEVRWKEEEVKWREDEIGRKDERVKKAEQELQKLQKEAKRMAEADFERKKRKLGGRK